MTAAMSRNPFLAPLAEGTVVPEGIHIEASVLHPAEVFRRQLTGAEFDMSEMSMASVVRLLDGGDDTWVALPVFPYRTFFHTWMLVRTDSSIDGPGDLAGRAVGLPEYPITGAVWTRGVLEHEFGVRPAEITWVCERQPGNDLSSALHFEPPAGIRVEYAAPGESLASLAAAGRIDAIAVPIVERGALDPSADELAAAVDAGRLRRLFPDRAAEQRRYRAKTGLVHINHTVVVRRSLVKANPDVVPALLSALEEAKRRVLATGARLLDLYATDPAVTVAVPPGAIDPVPYGIAGNREILRTLLGYLHEQGITTREWGVEEVFTAH